MGDVIYIDNRKRRKVKAKKEQTLFDTGYWGYKIDKQFAWYPVKTLDFDWIWMQSYYKFLTNTGFHKESYSWIDQGSTVTINKMYELKNKFLHSQKYKTPLL